MSKYKGKIEFSLRLPTRLHRTLRLLAKSELRTLNAQIELMLENELGRGK